MMVRIQRKLSQTACSTSQCYRYRLIDTQARFLLLNNKRLFHQATRYLWNKVINVVFIRHIPDFNGYELTTVPYPAQMEDELMVEPVNFWRAGHFMEKRKPIFPEKTRDLRGRRIFVVTFPHVPSTVREEVVSRPGDEDYNEEMYIKYTGLEIEIMQCLSNLMNFKPFLYEAGGDGRDKWGHQKMNGSFTGLLGELMAGRAQIALGNLQHSLFAQKLVDLSRPYMTQCFTFITPQSRTDLKLKTLILPFLLNTWTAILITLLLGGFVFFGLTRFHLHFNTSAAHKNFNEVKMIKSNILNLGIYPHTKNKKSRRIVNREEHQTKASGRGFYVFKGLVNSILYTYGMLMFVSLPQVPSGWAIRMMVGCWWFFSLLLVVAYRASLTAILAKPEPLVTIDTIVELVSSSVTCAGWGEPEKAFFTSSFDPDINKIGLKFETVGDVNRVMNWVLEGSYTYYENKYLLTYIMAQYDQERPDNLSGTVEGKQTKHMLHIMSDCILSSPISLGLERNSPLKPQIDILVQRMVESGLVHKWLDDVMAITHRRLGLQKVEQVQATMDTDKFSGAMLALAAGYLVSVLSLLIELLYWKLIVVKDPLFDKYNMSKFYFCKKRKP